MAGFLSIGLAGVGNAPKPEEKRRPKTTAERVREYVARQNEIGEIPPPRHRRLKEACRFDFRLFMVSYCRSVLKHLPSEELTRTLIRDVQDFYIYGGKTVKEYGRGTGKTTVINTCGITWAMLYGHSPYPIGIAATGKLAKKNLKNIKRLIAGSYEILVDFPAIAIPVRALRGISQRAKSQTYHGEPTNIEWGDERIVLPMLRDDSGKPLDRGCGAIHESYGIGGAIRGANESGQRPTSLAIDDPQTKKSAKSPKMVKDILEYIHGDALGLAGHDSTMSAFVTITPQCVGDVAYELTTGNNYREWDVSVVPFVTKTCPGWKKLMLQYVEQYASDVERGDKSHEGSRKWYLNHRHLFEGVTVVDPLQYDIKREIDAIHHVLNLRATLGEKSFNAEIMMDVSDPTANMALDADTVASRVNGAPRGVLPPGTDSVCGYCDVNITNGTGLHWVLVAFGPARVRAVIDYGTFPESGPLVPPNASDTVRNRLVAAGIRRVVDTIAAMRLKDAHGRKVQVTALGFDRGYLPAVIHRALFVIRRTVPLPFQLVATRGFPWNKFGTREKDTLRHGDHIFATRSRYGQYLATMAPYWREVMQSGFLETPLMPGSVSFFGTDPTRHHAIASHVCAERLVRKYTVEVKGRSLTAWDWQLLSNENHWGDALTHCTAIASWFHLFDDLSSVIDGAIIEPTTALPTVRQDDLFDPIANPAVRAAAEYEDDGTEGTGERLPPLPEETEFEGNPLQDDGDPGATEDVADVDRILKANPSLGIMYDTAKAALGRFDACRKVNKRVDKLMRKRHSLFKRGRFRK